MRRGFLARGSVALRLLLAFGPAGGAWADEPAREDVAGPEHGKLATSDATPVGARVVEVEASWDPSWNLHGTGAFERSPRGQSHSFGLGVTYGIVEAVDVAVSFSYALAHEAIDDLDPAEPASAHGRGLTNAALGGRWRWVDRPDLGLDLAVIAGLVIPANTDETVERVGLSQEYWGVGASLVASQDLGAFTGNLELGYTLPIGEDRGEERGTLFANLAGGWQVLPWLQPELELNAERSFATGSPDADLLAITAGVVAPFPQGYRLMAGAQYAAWGRHTGQFVGGRVAFKMAF